MKKLFKRFMGVIVLMLFVMSIVPVALAEEVDNSVDQPTEEVLEKKVDKVVKDKPKMKYDRIKRKLMQAREHKIKVKEKYMDARKKHIEHKIKLMDMRKSIKSCKGDDCAAKKVDFRRGLKNHLLKGLDVIDRSLERVYNRIDKSEKVSESEKEDLLANLEDLMNKAEDQRETVEALTEDSTAEEYRAALKETKELWREVKKTQKRMVSFLVNAKLGKLVDVKLDEYVNGMEMRIENLAEQGADVSELEGLLDDFKKHVEETKNNYQHAREAHADIKSGEEALNLWHEAQKEVREDLKETKKLLREFLSEFREVKSSLSEETTDEE